MTTRAIAASGTPIRTKSKKPYCPGPTTSVFTGEETGVMKAEDAASAFERVLSEYPAGDARLESMLKLAECRMRLNQRDDALALYARVIETYPGTDAASQAQRRLTQITQ